MTIAFVTGATGFLGGALVRRLASDGVQVKALARRPDRDGYIRDVDGVEVVRGDIADYDRMIDLMGGCDVVYHVAAATGGSYSVQYQTNVVGTSTVMQAAAECGVQRVVHVSSVSVYGYQVQEDVTEDADFDPTASDPYHETKIEAEKAVRNIGDELGLAYSIIRPGMIYGPRSNFWTKLFFKIAKRGIWIGDGSGTAYPIFVDDVVDMLCVLAEHPNAVGEAFNCTPDPAPTFREFLGAYAALAGQNGWFGIPPVLIRPIAGLAGLFAPKHSQIKDLPELLTLIQTRTTYRMNKAQNLLGWQPQVGLQDGIKRCVPYLLDEGLLS